MAFDQLTILLLPPGWVRRDAEDRGMPYLFGGFVRVASSVPDPEAGADRPLRLEDLCGWLEARGFTAEHQEPAHAVYGNGRVPAWGGPRHDTEVAAHAEAGGVSGIQVRFAIAADAPARLRRWEDFVAEICGAFRLRIGVREGEAVGPEAFIRLVRAAENWRFFAAEYGWGPAEVE